MSLAQWQLYDCPSDNEVALKDRGKIDRHHKQDKISLCLCNGLVREEKTGGVSWISLYKEMCISVLKLLTRVSVCGSKAHSSHLCDSHFHFPFPFPRYGKYGRYAWP